MWYLWGTTSHGREVQDEKEQMEQSFFRTFGDGNLAIIIFVSAVARSDAVKR